MNNTKPEDSAELTVPYCPTQEMYKAYRQALFGKKDILSGDRQTRNKQKARLRWQAMCDAARTPEKRPAMGDVERVAAEYMDVVKRIFELRKDGPPLAERDIMKDADALTVFDDLNSVGKHLSNLLDKKELPPLRYTLRMDGHQVQADIDAAAMTPNVATQDREMYIGPELATEAQLDAALLPAGFEKVQPDVATEVRCKHCVGTGMFCDECAGTGVATPGESMALRKVGFTCERTGERHTFNSMTDFIMAFLTIKQERDEARANVATQGGEHQWEGFYAMKKNHDKANLPSEATKAYKDGFEDGIAAEYQARERKAANVRELALLDIKARINAERYEFTPLTVDDASTDAEKELMCIIDYIEARVESALSHFDAKPDEVATQGGVITWENCPSHLRAELFPNATLPTEAANVRELVEALQWLYEVAMVSDANYAAVTNAAAVLSHFDTKPEASVEGRIEKLRELTELQCQPGNYNCNSYTHGMANGMIFAVAMLDNVEPKYMKAPGVWLDDKLTPTKLSETTEAGDGK